ncbi:MAG: 16S rRNA (cytosine(1402)-N(4))-methyltransferase RsmH [Thermodesulfobacteriota bacterium]
MFLHQPVMLEEAMAALAPMKGGRYVDGTSGGGGHTRALLALVGPKGRVLGLDRDPDALRHLEDSLQAEAPNLILRRANFSDLDLILSEIGWEKADGMLLDLGLSSHQLERSGRGFSFARPEPLDMRMDPDRGRPARDLVNRLPEKDLADLIFHLGEEKASRRVARAIVRARERGPLTTSLELAEAVRRALRRPGRPPRLDPATRTFQALRLAVNRELEHLEAFLTKAPALLKPSGRLAVISFHSLEDRLVKQALHRTEPLEPAGRPYLKALYKKPLRPSVQETAANPRARSARLRAGELIVPAGRS